MTQAPLPPAQKAPTLLARLACAARPRLLAASCVYAVPRRGARRVFPDPPGESFHRVTPKCHTERASRRNCRAIGGFAAGRRRQTRHNRGDAQDIHRRHPRACAAHRGKRRQFWIDILASRRRGGTLYVGVTNDLVRRVYAHREGLVAGFTKKYGVTMRVYYEAHDTAVAAIQRETNIKYGPREWKIDLILSINPEWRDLHDELHPLNAVIDDVAGSAPTAPIPASPGRVPRA
jgi:putative endonuclease